jgi:phosphoserine phosphatase
MTIYGSMLEVLGYLRANGYRTFIATGGTAGFVREYSELLSAALLPALCVVAQPVASSTI